MSIEQKEPGAQTQGSATQRRYRTLAVVKQEAITRVERPLEDSVFVWPHLLVREFFASTMLMVVITILSIQIDAPLRDPANPNGWVRTSGGVLEHWAGKSKHHIERRDVNTTA